ncbi:MAG: sigma-70 family RNA polymerase sigma factor [Candidatus Kapabacteria bacterium]|nr:sigma-70 family RNA polymerase sigma factor [Candidatus Kapabacteria bacterium]
MSDTPQQAADSSGEDEAIIRDVLAGNVNAFATLERKYRRIVFFLVRKMIRDEEDVNDLVQDTFVKAFQALPSFRFEYPFSRWLFKIASNRCIDHLRRRRFAMVSIDAPVRSKGGEEFYMEPEDRGPTPDVTLLSKERIALLQEALAKIPEKYREVIRLRHSEELEYQEIADQLNQPLGTVKANLFRARKMLYKMLLKHGSHFEEYLDQDEGGR